MLVTKDKEGNMPQTVEERLAVLEQKVQELTDVEAIRRLRFRYHECVNETKRSCSQIVES